MIKILRKMLIINNEDIPSGTFLDGDQYGL